MANYLLNDINVVQRINNQRLRWLGDDVWMEEDVLAKRVYDAEVGEKDDPEEAL